MRTLSESERDVMHIQNDAIITPEGLVFWKSNNHVPPLDILKRVVAEGVQGIDLVRCEQAIKEQEMAWIQEYLSNPRRPSAEERYEARAAFGKGVELVDVISGEKWTT